MATRMQQRRGTAAQWTAANPILAAGEIGFETDTNKFKMGNGSSAWSALQYFANAAELTALIDGAPDLLNTIGELAEALGGDPDFLTQLATLTDLSDGIGAHHNATQDVHGIADTADLVTTSMLANATTPSSLGYSALAGFGLEYDATNDALDVNQLVVATKTFVTDEVGTHSSDTTNVHGIADTSALALTADVTSNISTAVSEHNSDTTNVHGISDTSALATKTYADDAVTAHNFDTTNVHGIADTSALAVLDDVTTAVSDHNDETLSVHGIANTANLATKTYADDAVSAHNSDTTNVHGIADTSALVTKTYVDNADSTLQTNIDAKAPIANPTFTGTVSGVTKAMVGLGNVDNTSDANKPVSTATQTALDLKAPKAAPTFTGTLTAEDVTISGNLTVSGTTTTVSAQDLVVSDPLIYIGEGNTANLVDIGLVGNFNNGTYQHTGIVRDASAGTWKLFKGVTDEPTTTINFAQGSLDDLAVAGLTATTVTPSAGVVFTDGTQTKEGVVSRTPIIQKTDSYTLSALTERDSLVEINKSTAVTLTIPTDATVNYPVGTSIDILQTGAGQVTIAGAGGVTVNATPGLKLRTTWSSATLFKRAANTWVVYGDLTA